MMYRDWREVTKSLLSSKGPMNSSNLPKSKMKRPETKVYVKWVIDEITKDRASFSECTKGKGIIATRDRFLKFLRTEEAKEA
jgi:tRNA ligase